MRHLLAAAAAAVLLPAAAIADVAPEPELQALSDARPNGCEARVRITWNGHALEAATDGPDCAQAVVTATLRDADGKPVWSETFVTQFVFGLKDATSKGAMDFALAQWIWQEGAQFQTTADLPDWTGETPVSGEFPFYPDAPYTDKKLWAETRAAKDPMFCLPQGMESLACFAVRAGEVVKIGVQTFPG